MEFHEKDYILGVWFAAKRNGDNWMMTILKRNGEWLGEYRFRYAEDTKAFHSNDRKSFYGLKIDGSLPEEDVILKMSEFFDIIKREYNDESDFVEIKGDVQKFMFQLAQRPWAHIKTINTAGKSKEEVEKEFEESTGSNLNLKRR